ncbi:MAG TPA: TonB-dependent receptor [Chitinophagaceae bacterium]|nr:TonB-dependent receptor [Chitinophagaceae bacterium]
MKLHIALIAVIIPFLTAAQSRIIARTVDEKRNIPVLASLHIQKTRTGSSTDSLGIAVINFPSTGKFTIVATAVGYKAAEIDVVIPYLKDTLLIMMETEEEEMEEIVVQSTRTSRTIANVPTRVETIELEEIDEKNNMRPSNVAMLLHESTGIQVQQTSATSGNSSIRIQGLDGRYTQLLKDGFPSFGNFSSGLSVLEIPPIDLKQVEIIKGPVSPLFGGGAIAGVVNFISKTPKARPEYNLIINQSNIGQTNIGGFLSSRGRKLGYTLLALYNRSAPYDVDKDDFTEVPKSGEFTIHPKLFFYPNEGTTIILGNSLTSGERTGGDIQVIKDRPDTLHQYFERNKTIRNISTFEFEKLFGDSRRFIARQSFSLFDRTIDIPSYTFAGIEYNSYTDLSYVSKAGKHAFVLGGNIIYSKFDERQGSDRDNTASTGGLYGQYTWDATEKVKLESGLRVDIANYKNKIYSNTEIFLLPRMSLLVNYNSKWSSRAGVGIGYKTPTLFTEQTETIQYKNVDQLNNVNSERSYGGTADVNFRTPIGDQLAFTFNHMFFYTWINNPLLLESYGVDNYRFINGNRPVQSAGFEANARVVYKERFKLFLGYTFTDTKARYLTGNQNLPLVPRNKLNTALIYEKEGSVKIGLEGYFTGRQYLSNGTRTPAFSELGFMAEKIFRKFSLFINFENFTDTRQSKYKSVVNGSHLNPTFDEIWTHTEGFVINGGVKIKLRP